MPKRKQGCLEGVSSSRTRLEDPEVPSTPSTGFDENHPLIRSLPEGARERYNVFRNGKFDKNWYLDWDFLKEVGLADELREKLRACGLDKVFNIIEPVYGELTLEFYCTYERRNIADARSIEAAVKFRLGGQWHKFTYDEFSEACGFSETNYRQVHVETRYPEGFRDRDFWREIIHENCTLNYEPKRSKSANLRDPVLRIFHRILSLTLTGRREPTVCQAGDMVYMYCFERRIPTHPGFLFAAYIEKKIDMKSLAYISAGSFITHLARNLGVIEQHLPTLTKISDMVPLGKDTLLKMGVIKRSGEGYEVLGGGESDSDSDDDLWIVNPNKYVGESEVQSQPRGDPTADQSRRSRRQSQRQQPASLSIEHRLDNLSQQQKHLVHQQQQIIENQNVICRQIDWMATALAEACSQLQVTLSSPRPPFDCPTYYTDDFDDE